MSATLVTLINVELFWSKVKILGPDDCWEWQGWKDKDGYGGFANIHNTTIKAHRTTWVLTYGEIPDELQELHTCDNRPCCNPNHLFLGTPLDNMRDMIRKGRMASPEQTVCRGEDNGLAKLTWKLVHEMRADYVPGVEPMYISAMKYGISRSEFGKIINNQVWKE